MFNIDRRLIHNFDWIMLGVTVLISLIGILTIYSATRPIGIEDHPAFYLKQVNLVDTRSFSSFFYCKL